MGSPEPPAGSTSAPPGTDLTVMDTLLIRAARPLTARAGSTSLYRSGVA
jgi:hypothetical protein